MAEEAAGDNGRYWAFISYSHRDAAFGRRLHRKLETYALPRRLVGRKTAQGTAPRKLAPIFRDREELAAAHDLSTEVRAALKASRCLIVVCSPASAASRWVGREIEVFRELHPGRPILAAVRDGEPEDCFPPGLLGKDASGAAIEPLAADFRRGRDGEHLGLLKLVAGILGLGLDELVQRDATRRNQRVTAVTAAALAGMLVMGVLTAFALSARQEAERQRGEAERQRSEAEGLVEYMLTDLRDGLKGVGRLDVMTAVNKRALKYYDHDQRDLSDLDQAQRARILLALGEDDENRGNLTAALRKFDEAGRATSMLLAKYPHDAERMLDQAQTEFWLGSVDYLNKNYASAERRFLSYKRLADLMTQVDPENPRYQMEAGMAESNLCSIAQTKPGAAAEAIRACKAAIEHTERAARAPHPPPDAENSLADQHAWLADAFAASGRGNEAFAEREKEARILNDLIAKDPNNLERKFAWVSHEIALALLDEAQHRTDDAKDKLLRARAMIEPMTKLEPANAGWRSQLSWIDKELQKLTDVKSQRSEK